MEAKELRIGNWIEDDLGGELQIEARTFNNLDGWQQPIPLTEEWLIGFGFKKTFDEWSIKNVSFTLEVGTLELYTGMGNEYPMDIIIKHVHQLQNLYFALTGKELIRKDG